MCYTPPMVDDQTILVFPSCGVTTLPLCAPYELVCCMASGPGGHALRVLLDTGTDPSAVGAGVGRRVAPPTGGSGRGHGGGWELVACSRGGVAPARGRGITSCPAVPPSRPATRVGSFVD